MLFPGHFAFNRERHEFAVLLVLLAQVFPTIAQTAGFDVFTSPSSPGQVIPAGSTFTIKWTPSSPAGTISIVLLEGATNISLQLGPTIASGIESTTGSYAWSVPTSLTSFPYFGFQLALDSDTDTFQYSTYFSISGLEGTVPASSTPSATPVSTTTKVSVASPTPSSSSTPSTTPSSSTTSSASSIHSSSTASSTTTSQTTLFPTTSPTTSSSPPQSSTSTPSAAADTNSSSLSPGAKAGIGIGAALGGILLFALIAFTFFHYGKRAATESNANESTWEKAELGTERPSRLGAGGLSELRGEGAGVAELAGREREIAELEAGRRNEEEGG